MNTIEQCVLDEIDLDGLLDFLSDLIAVKSLDGSPEENVAQEKIAELMRTLGMRVDQWEMDFSKLSKHPAYSVEVKRSRGVGVVGVLGDSGPSLILNGHIDVVPVENEELWHNPPWQGTLRDGKVYGRGSVDMKGGLCCALFAAKAIQDVGAKLKGKLLIQSVIGEEDGGVGSLAAMLRGYQADGAIIMEPTDLTLAPSQAGALNFRVSVTGKTAHGAVRDEGVSAIEKFILLHEALLRFEEERNRAVNDPLFAEYSRPIPLNIGNLQAGDWASNVPEKLVFEGRFGVAADEDPVEAKADFQRCLLKAADEDEWLRQNPPSLEWWGGQFEPAQTKLDAHVLSVLSEAYEDLHGEAPVQRGVTYGADMRLLVNYAQTPCVLFGPGDVRIAHQPDEFVPIDDMLKVTRCLALTVMRFCGIVENEETV